VDRWATFDCYGTLIDWEGGIVTALLQLWPDADGGRLLRTYHEIEPVVQAGRSIPYREVLRIVLLELASREGRSLPAGREGWLGDSLPLWPPFPDVPEELRAVRQGGWKLGILSNTDPDLLAASFRAIGVEPDLVITAAEARSYKPAHGHWLRFRELARPDPRRHVHVAASPFHDLAPAAELGIPAVWINWTGAASDLPRAAELPDISELPEALDRLVS